MKALPIRCFALPPFNYLRIGVRRDRTTLKFGIRDPSSRPVLYTVSFL